MRLALHFMFKLVFILLWCRNTYAIQMSDKAENNTLTIAFAFSWTGVWPAGRTIGGAFVVGLDEVHRRNLLPGYALEWKFRDSSCLSLIHI